MDGHFVNQLTVTASAENEGGYSVPMTVALTNYPTVTWTETITVNINEPADPDTVCSIIPGEYENELLATYFVNTGVEQFDLRASFSFVGPCEASSYSLT